MQEQLDLAWEQHAAQHQLDCHHCSKWRDMRRWSTSIFIMLFANCLAVHWLQGVCTSFVGLAVKSRFFLFGGGVSMAGDAALRHVLMFMVRYPALPHPSQPCIAPPLPARPCPAPPPFSPAPPQPSPAPPQPILTLPLAASAQPCPTPSQPCVAPPLPSLPSPAPPPPSPAPPPASLTLPLPSLPSPVPPPPSPSPPPPSLALPLPSLPSPAQPPPSPAQPPPSLALPLPALPSPAPPPPSPALPCPALQAAVSVVQCMSSSSSSRL
ncbi:hypothetical protein V8C86DRAFT_123487 [Haematococcus lacustris]